MFSTFLYNLIIIDFNGTLHVTEKASFIAVIPVYVYLFLPNCVIYVQNENIQRKHINNFVAFCRVFVVTRWQYMTSEGVYCYNLYHIIIIENKAAPKKLSFSIQTKVTQACHLFIQSSIIVWLWGLFCTFWSTEICILDCK